MLRAGKRAERSKKGLTSRVTRIWPLFCSQIKLQAGGAARYKTGALFQAGGRLFEACSGLAGGQCITGLRIICRRAGKASYARTWGACSTCNGHKLVEFATAYGLGG